MNRIRIVLAVVATVVGPQPTLPQTLPPAMARMRLRIGTPGAPTPGRGEDGTWIVGHLDRVDPDSLWLRVDRPDGPVVTVDRAVITRMELSSGRRRHPVTGALWGAGAGFGLGLLTLAALNDCAVEARGWVFDICGRNRDLVLLGSVAAGAAWGAVIGWLVTTERWVPMPPGGLVVTAAGGRIALALRLPVPK